MISRLFKFWCITRKNWDRVATYLCFTAFGIYSLFRLPTISGNMPKWFLTLFYLELMLGGILLMISVYHQSYWFRIAGYFVYAAGMITLAGRIAFTTGSPVWVLALGFAFQGIMSIRYISRDKVVAQQLGGVVKELERRKGGSS